MTTAPWWIRTLSAGALLAVGVIWFVADRHPATAVAALFLAGVLVKQHVKEIRKCNASPIYARRLPPSRRPKKRSATTR